MAETMTSYALCHVDDIASRQARGFVLARRYEDGVVRSWLIFVLRWGKRVIAYENHCPHEGVHLDWERDQFLDADGLRFLCGKHGALFDFGTGECVAGPCVGARLTPVDVMVDDDGDICVIGVTLEEDDDVDSGQGAE